VAFIFWYASKVRVEEKKKKIREGKGKKKKEERNNMNKKDTCERWEKTVHRVRV